MYVFEDNEAVIKMIIKGRSPTMRHVSRTHRVGLDWLFDRINLDSKIQVKYIDTKNQLADILTKGNPGKSVVEDDRSGKPDEISWNAMHQVRPHHEEPLLDGNAQSVR